jgi:RNA polymerase sigma factor (sigma-70 family)
MARSAEFERWLQRAIDQQIAVGCAIHLARNRHLAEDTLQEAYTRAWQHRDEIESEEHLANWLRCVVVNLLREHYRRKKNHTPALENPDAVVDERPHLLEEEDREHLKHYLDRLSANERLLIELRYFEERTLEEIHALHPEWGSVTTIWKRVAEVCHKLREWMSQGDAVVP